MSVQLPSHAHAGSSRCVPGRDAPKWGRSLPARKSRVPACERIIRELFSSAGIRVDGPHPWDIAVHDRRFFSRVLSGGNLGLGESYMDGWWDCGCLDGMFERVVRAGLERRLPRGARTALAYFQARLSGCGAKWRAFEVGRKHYDLGNDLFAAMLDKRMVYTCGYWKNATSLDAAQEHKLDLVCRKIGVQPGQTILDIGCGWGSFAKFAAEKYAARVVGITISREQWELGQSLCRGLPVDLRLQDYRDVRETFDHIVSLGMFEHVNTRHHATFMRMARRCLKDGGLFLLHTIGENTTSEVCDPWFAKYIFPNSKIPSLVQIGAAHEGLFVMEDWHNFGPDYDRTLVAWHENFERHWPELRARYDERFRRMWNYYLLCSAGAFRARDLQLWQIVFSKTGDRVPYPNPIRCADRGNERSLENPSVPPSTGCRAGTAESTEPEGL